jgi:hypothetical protein
MTLRMPGVPYLGPPDGNWSGGGIVRPPNGVVVHIAEGSYQGTIGWQRNPAARVSSYFVVSRAGDIAQMLDLDVMAWTQGAGNPTWIGVENEGFHTQAFTDAQAQANARIFAWVVSLWPGRVPYTVANSPGQHGLGWHGMGGAAWGNHPDCPGPPNVALLPDIVARAVRINNGGGPGSQKAAVTGMIGLRDPEGGEFTIDMSSWSETGYYYAPVVDGIRSAALQAGGVVMVTNGTRPGAFGPSAAQVRAKAIDDIATAVVAKLPSGGGTGGPTVAQIAAAVRAELDSTTLPSVPGTLREAS